MREPPPHASHHHTRAKRGSTSEPRANCESKTTLLLTWLVVVRQIGQQKITYYVYMNILQGSPARPPARPPHKTHTHTNRHKNAAKTQHRSPRFTHAYLSAQQQQQQPHTIFVLCVRFVCIVQQRHETDTNSHTHIIQQMYTLYFMHVC